MNEYVEIRGVRIQNVDDMYRTLDRYNIYNNILCGEIQYDIYATIRLQSRLGKLTFLNKFKLYPFSSYTYIIEYLNNVYDNGANIIEFFTPFRYSYKYTSITSNKLKPILKTIKRINNALTITELTQDQINTSNQLLRYYNIDIRKRAISHFKYSKLSTFSDSTGIIFETPFMSVTADKGEIPEEVYKFLTYNNDAETYLNKTTIKSLNKL